MAGVIVGVAALPHPPLLVPELVGGAVAETEPVRAACLAAVAELRESTEDWLVVFAGQSTRATSRGRGSFGGFGGPGAEVIVQLDDREPDQTTRPDSDWPLPVLIAAWLRGQVGAHRLRMCPFSPRLSAADSLAAGRELAEAESDDRAVGCWSSATGAPADPNARHCHPTRVGRPSTTPWPEHWPSPHRMPWPPWTRERPTNSVYPVGSGGRSSRARSWPHHGDGRHSCAIRQPPSVSAITSPHGGRIPRSRVATGDPEQSRASAPVRRATRTASGTAGRSAGSTALGSRA